MAPDPADVSAVLTAIGDCAGVSDLRDDDPRPYPDLLPHVRTALDWLAADQPAGAAWPKDGIVRPVPAGPDVTLRLMVGTSVEYGPRASIIFERWGGDTPVARLTRAVADRLSATITMHVAITGDLKAIYMPGDTKTWWAFGVAVTPSPGLIDAYRLNQSGAYHTIHEPGHRERVARLSLPPGWMPDHGREYR